MDQRSGLPMVELHYPLRGSVSPCSIQLLNVDDVAFRTKIAIHVVMICAAGPIVPTTEPKPGTMMAFATPATSRSPVAIPLGRAWVFLRGSRLRFYLSTRSSTRNAWRKERRRQMRKPRLEVMLRQARPLPKTDAHQMLALLESLPWRRY